jgi:hypothetical protein
MPAHCPILDQPCREQACAWWTVQECGIVTIAKSVEGMKFKMR